MIILFEYYNYKHNLYHIYIYGDGIHEFHIEGQTRTKPIRQVVISGCCAAVVEAGSRELQPENQMSQMSQTGQKLFYKSIWMPQLGLQVRRTRQISSNLSDSKFAKQNVLLHVLFFSMAITGVLRTPSSRWRVDFRGPVAIPIPRVTLSTSWHSLKRSSPWIAKESQVFEASISRCF